MSDSKTPKKSETLSKKNERTKTDVPKTETVNTETKALENSVSKSVSKPKSASQSSTSHFSNVSTPQYRSGWDDIFGGGGDVGKIVSDDARKNDFPKKLNILDYDIDLILRDVLDVAFYEVARKRGFNMSGKEEFVRFEYNLSCEIKEK
jgi:hypothetical protein